MKAFPQEYRHIWWLILAVFAGAVATDSGHYEGYKVVRVTPKSVEHVDILSKFRNNSEIDFWSFGSTVGSLNTLSISPSELRNVLDTFKDADMPSEIIIENLHETLELELEEQRNASRKPWRIDSTMAHDRYYHYQEMVDYARSIERTVPYVKTEVIGKTREGRDIVAILLSTSNGERNPGVLVDAGVRAREWISSATAFYLFDQIATNKPIADELLFNLDWYIIPNLNPDGYEWTFRDATARMWLKNRGATPNQNCVGVDISRNFDYHWNEVGASQDPCAENYSGTRAFSESESIALRDYIMKYKSSITMYLNLQSFGNYILHPWGFTPSLPVDADLLKRIGSDANAAMESAGSQTYRVGSYANLRDVSSGGSADYTYGVHNIRKVFTMILPGGGNNGYDIPPANIRRTADIVLQGLRVFAKNANLSKCS